MKIAFLVPDNRDVFRQFDLPKPVFGPAPDALLSGLAELAAQGKCEVHVLSCSHVPSQVPSKIYDGRVFYHQLQVGSIGYLKTLYWGCSNAIRTALRSIRPSIVHGQGTERYCALSATRSGYPNLLTLHGNMRSVARVNHARPFSFYWITARLESWVLPRTNGVICLSHYTQENVRALARRTWVVPNAVEGRFLAPTVQVPPPPKNIVLSCLGTICHHKNQNWLIRALAPLQSEFHFTLNLYGAKIPGSPYTAEFESLVQQYPWVHTFGHVPREQLQQAYQESSLVLIPSLEDNCPMIVLEAMACGVPVMGARIGGIPDLIQHDKTGWLYESQNVEEFQQLLRNALSAPEELRAKGQAAYTEIRQKFTPLKIAQRHLEIYQEVVEKTMTS